MKRLGGRHFAMNDSVRDYGELTVEIGDDAIHPALLAYPLCFGSDVSPILQPIDADNRNEIGIRQVQPGIDLIVGDESIGGYPLSGIFAKESRSRAKMSERCHPVRQDRR